jgi:hypothetical protein
MELAPELEPHVMPRTAPMASWPVTLHVAIERTDQAAFTWDDADPAVVWDSPAVDTYVWDAAVSAGGFVDAACDLVSLDTDPGEADGLGLMPAVVCNLTLANDHGQWTAWSADGRLVYWSLGRRLAVWAVLADASTYWVFTGRISGWHERADGYVEVTAFDGLAELAQPIVTGTDSWTPGDPADTAYARVVKIATAAGYTDTISAGAGSAWEVLLAAPPSTRTPLDEIYATMLSDGGQIMADANGVIYVWDRRWRLGRPDQTTIPTVSDNVCDPDVADVWDVELATEDTDLATAVHLANTAGLTADATDGTVTAERWRLTHPEPDLWMLQGDGDSLAGYLLTVYSRHAMRLGAFTLHLVPVRGRDLTAPVNPWTVAAALRRGDLVRYVHDYTAADGTPGRLDQYHRIDTVAHAITAETWVATYRASSAVTYVDAMAWDLTPYLWDDTNPDNVWS